MKDRSYHELRSGGKNTIIFSLASCVLGVKTALSAELTAPLKIVLHLLLLFPLAAKAIVYFSRWKRSWEGPFERTGGGARGGSGRLAPSLTQGRSSRPDLSDADLCTWAPTCLSVGTALSVSIEPSCHSLLQSLPRHSESPRLPFRCDIVPWKHSDPRSEVSVPSLTPRLLTDSCHPALKHPPGRAVGEASASEAKSGPGGSEPARSSPLLPSHLPRKERVDTLSAVVPLWVACVFGTECSSQEHGTNQVSDSCDYRPPVSSSLSNPNFFAPFPL